MNRKYDVCAIGNALVDYEIEVEDGFFVENKVEKGFNCVVLVLTANKQYI